MKAFFVYDEAFWRADGFNGQLISDVGPARMSNDTCLPGDDHGVILLFLEGEQARTFGRLPEDERRAALTAELVRHFGSQAAHPEFYVDGEWSDRQWTRGCYNANLGPHVWTNYGHALDRCPSARSTGPQPIPQPIGAPTWRAPSRPASGRLGPSSNN